MALLRPVTVAAIAWCAVLVYAPAARAECGGSPVASGAVSLDVGGVMRTFVVRVPSDADGRRPLPVVFAFHPFGMNAQYMQSRVPLQRVWPEAIVIYPNAIGGRGAGGFAPAWQGQVDPDNRDLRFFDAMLAWLREHACTDPARVFVLGYSNGAGFAYLVACERSEAIAGVAAVSGRLPCAPSAPKPVVMTHGLGDRTIGYDQAIAAARAWSTQNRCSAPPKAGAPGCFAAEGCAGGPVLMCTHEGGHEYDLPFTRTAAEFFRKIP